MDDVEITDVEEENSPFLVEKAPLDNQDLSSVSLLVGELLSQYGWYLLVGTVVVYLLIQYLSKRISSRSSSSSPEQTLQDAALVAKRQEGMEASRMKMQQELDAKAVIFKEKQRQQEEEKRRQKIELWESMQPGRSFKSGKTSRTTEEADSSTTASKPKSDKKPLRSEDYNPLTGQGGSSCAWRPGRRAPSSGG
ncbi:selenoprotein S [Pseudoliparis swirei]|uniref:selenoprotein S n=1 Tax=Pseudoliparis swirei TaxID=2059687 RepID=UPI0024BDB757|nr:selenoprotein S [Pseudoliparis swirei]